MAEEILIRWSSDKSSIEADIDNVDKAVSEKKEELIDENKRIAQDVLGVLTDQRQQQMIINTKTDIENQRLGSLMTHIENLRNESQFVENASLEQRIEFNAITREIRLAQQEVDDLKSKVKAVKQEVSVAKDTLRAVSAGVSAALGFLALATAITGDVQDIAFSSALTVASSTISLAVAYGTLGAASGNLALIAAAGAAASSAASIINTLKAYQTREQFRINSLSRRATNRSNY